MSLLKEEFDRNGVVVIREALARVSVEELQAAWAAYYSTERLVNRWNPVEVKGPFPELLEAMPRMPDIYRHVMDVLDHGCACYNFRFVVKDEHSTKPVFLHQDCGYHIGSLPKLSAFVPLSSVIPENGGMKFWLGTHKYGYLGDVGEINPAIHPGTPNVICPVLAPGDIVLMHSALWHESGPKVTGPNRVMADIIYQHADDPARAIPREGVFVRSRSSRLAELQAQADAK